MDIEKVFEEYRKGDEGKRLSLFLGFRDLREQFSRIEDETSSNDLGIIRFPWNRKHRLARAA